jgi:formamidopyrimidine-DNA glycosylase
MPEGPEVECTRQYLQPLIGKTVRIIQLTELSQKYPKYMNKQPDFDWFKGQRLIDIERIGKFLIWRFDGKKVVLNHLGMSGKWILLEKDNQSLTSHAKALIYFEKCPHAVFDDIRNFGQFKIFESYDAVMQHDPIRKMGVDGLAKPFPMKEFLVKLNKPNYANREIGAVLVDQKLVAGVGNIYKSESLALAKINPTRLVKTLTKKERKELGLAISKTLWKAVDCNGSTFGTFQIPTGQDGSAQNWHKVYGKHGESCQECGKEITRIVQGNRSTFYCPECQK